MPLVKKTFSAVFGLLAAMFLFQYCTSDKSPPPSSNNTAADSVRNPCADSVKISFQSDIKPIFENNCSKSGCHNQVGNANYAFNNYEGISNGVTKGRVLGAINHEEGYYNMPAGGNKLPDSTICKVERWEENGAPNN